MSLKSINVVKLTFLPSNFARRITSASPSTFDSSQAGSFSSFVHDESRLCLRNCQCLRYGNRFLLHVIMRQWKRDIGPRCGLCESFLQSLWFETFAIRCMSS